MTTPRIEEMVEEMAQQEWLLIGDVPIAQNWLRTALTKAYQAGRDEEVGKCNYLKIVTHRVFIHPDDEKKNIPPVFEANVELQNVDTNRITYPTVLFKYDTIKPLQDNK